MNIIVVLRNLYGNPDPFEDELLVGTSDVNAISEACELRDSINGSTVTALLFSERESDYEKVLRKAASYGADRAIHIPVDDFDFTDANIFSKLIAKTVYKFLQGTISENGIVKMDPSMEKDFNRAAYADALLVFGRLAYDGDSVNIATQVASRLAWTKAIYSRNMSNDMVFTRPLDGGRSMRAKLIPPGVLHTIRKEGLRRQAKVSDILRAYSDEFQVESFDESVIQELITEATRGRKLTPGHQEIPPYSESKEMINLNGISDAETAGNIIELLKSLGFEARNK